MPSPSSPRLRTTRIIQALLALALLPRVASLAEEPCARPCGRDLTCGALQSSFTCDAISGLGCDCTGCCSTWLTRAQHGTATGAGLPLDADAAPKGGRVLSEASPEPEDEILPEPSPEPSPSPLPMPPTTGGGEACARPCGRGLTCSTIYGAFTCDVLSSGLGCDCTGCCSTWLTPLAPPAPPPPLPPPPQSPAPLLPPMAPGGLVVGSTAELRTALEEGSNHINLLPIVYTLGGEPLNVSGGDVTLEGLGGEQGATLDAEGLSRAINVIGGGRLTLRRVHIVNGVAETGGGLLVQGAGSSLLMLQASVRDCVAIGGMRDTDGGGELAQSPPPLPALPVPPTLTDHARCSAGPHAHRRALPDDGRERRPGGEHDRRLRDGPHRRRPLCHTPG